ncbi:hypothetical protein AVE30378_02516 [Achromobacter veterisilvae]|uniref:Uncharacterized protein n=1 Tax=Achromobacter veterisilvae TaxID=2069367 RepID=A0A446CHD8_9BURK|nr:hypothetical protein [Achromobacter veterisilvae]SSW67231.1 hypothetical protein AVE30378_02516 [Achromobacter veterisilvae]
MTTIRHHSTEMQTARRMTAEQLRLLGVRVKPATSNAQLAELIAERMGWMAPETTPDALYPFLLRFLDVSRSAVTPAPYRPFARKPMRYDLTMRTIAARAAADQPHMTHAASNVVTWRELAA